MTIICRKNNIVASDSLFFVSKFGCSSVEYSQKLFLNSAKTCLIAFSGNLIAKENVKYLDILADHIYNKELLDENLTNNFEKDLPESISDFMYFSIKNNLDLFFSILTKKKTYTFLFENNSWSFHCNDYDSFFAIGSGYTDSLIFKTFDENDVVGTVQDVIKSIGSCGGNINVFDLNLLKDL